MDVASVVGVMRTSYAQFVITVRTSTVAPLSQSPVFGSFSEQRALRSTPRGAAATVEPQGAGLCTLPGRDVHMHPRRLKQT